jgi:UDP-N-acetylmuramate dehydrogenase
LIAAFDSVVIVGKIPKATMNTTTKPPSLQTQLNLAEPKSAVDSIYLPDTDCVIESHVPLADLTSFRVGGPAQWYVTPRNGEQIQASVQWGQHHQLPITFLGAGSNLLVSDQGVPGLVISTKYLRESHYDDETGRIKVQAGEPIARLAWKAAKRGWRGLEWGVGIPGTVGGAVVMNAGAHRSCLADILVSTTVLTPQGELLELTPEDLDFSYRTSNLQGSDRLVIAATFQLEPGFDKDAVRGDTTRHLHQRRNSQPYHLPSCGSVFRNPESYAAGWLIEQVGLKGYQIGDAQVAQRHANFILNRGNATATDIFRLICHVQGQVEENWSIQLHPEVKLLGEFSP